MISDCKLSDVRKNIRETILSHSITTDFLFTHHKFSYQRFLAAITFYLFPAIFLFNFNV